MRVSKIQYNPTLTVEENAKKNGVTDAAIRYYIKVRGIDRALDRKLNIIQECRKYLKKHPKASKRELHEQTKHSLSTIYEYWDYIIGVKSISDFDSSAQKYETVQKDSIRTNGKELASSLLQDAHDVLEFADSLDVSKFSKWVKKHNNLPLICIGNGGKHTSYPALLYEMMSGVARTVTPLEFASISPAAIQNSKILLLSSGGKNQDIVYATQRALSHASPENIACLTFSDEETNKVSKLLNGKNVFVYKNPYTDGFISIRSKILTDAILYRTFSGKDAISQFIKDERKYDYRINVRGILPNPKDIKHYSVLYSSYGEPVAHDIESTMTESGVASVQICDYRNYCHGRFIFGSNHPQETCMILLITPRERELAKRIRENVLPSNIPIVEITTERNDALATIELLLDSMYFIFDVAERYHGVNPNSPQNLSGIDKRFPISGVKFLSELSNSGEMCIWNEDEYRAKTLKEEIDSLLLIEHNNTVALSEHPSYLPLPTKQDLRRDEQYDTSKYYCVAFRSKNDLWKDMPVPFGNMNGGYPYTMDGIEFPTSEHAYIFGIFSHNTPEHISLQKELLAEQSGYNAKRGIRNTHKSQWRTDWSDFNLDWMLYCVWHKAKECETFRNLLMAIPQGTTIIEDVSFKPYEANGADFWGARNPEKKAFGKLAKKYAEALNIKTQKATDEVEDRLLWDYCNVGVYEGKNVMGKILMIVKDCLHNGTEPDIDYDLLRNKDIHFLGKRIFI